MPYKDPDAEKAHYKVYRARRWKWLLDKKKAYRDAHREELNIKAVAYYVDHRDERRAYQAAYKLAHHDVILAKHKEYYVKRKENFKCYYIEHREKLIANTRVNQEKHFVNFICQECGQQASGPAESKFCSRKCRNTHNVGPKSSNWRGGISSWPYCPKFNESLKERVRSQFGRRCFLSGKEENGRKLAVHHCDYLKSQGCQGQRWSLLPLDHSWHSKTNTKRWYWFALLRDYWVYKYLIFHGMDIYEGPDRTAWLWEMYNQDAWT